MKLLKYFISFAAAAGMLSACTTDLEMVETLPIENAVPATIHEFSEDIVVTADNQEEEVVFSWDAADFGAPTQISYSVLASYEGMTLTLFSGISTTSYTATKGVLNNRVALSVEDGGLGLPLETPVPVEFFIGATVGANYATVYSNKTSVNFTATGAEKQYPGVWVIGDYCGWSHDASQFLYSFTEDEVNYEGFIDFGDKAANGFKLTGIGGWDDSCNWGTDGDQPAPEEEAASITLISSGGSGNISCYSKRYYKFAFNKTTLTLQVKSSFDQLGVIGGFNGWGGDAVMEFNPAKRRFWVDIENLEGEIKFRADAGWDVNWGAGDSEGTLAAGGGNINVTELGNYRVYAYLSDSNNLYYELDAKMFGKDEVAGGGNEPEPGPGPEVPEEKPNLWDVIGAVNGTAWSGAAAYMTEVGPDIWYSDFVSVEGEFKFRYNNGWDTQLGKGAADIAADGSLCVGSSDGGSGNFSLPEGTYQFVLDAAAGTVRAIAIDGTGYGLIGNIAGDGWSRDLMLFPDGGKLAAKGVSLTTANEFKIRLGQAWATSYGYGVMTPNSVAKGNSANGANISVSEDGIYDLYLDLTTENIYVMKAGVDPSTATAPGQVAIDLTGHSWGLIGTITNWADDILMTAEGDFAVAKGVTITTADEFKVRADGAWDLSYGDGVTVTINEGVELKKGGDNLKVSANGTYDIYFGLRSAYIYVMEAGKTPVL